MKTQNNNSFHEKIFLRYDFSKKILSNEGKEFLKWDACENINRHINFSCRFFVGPGTNWFFEKVIQTKAGSLKDRGHRPKRECRVQVSADRNGRRLSESLAEGTSKQRQ